MNAPPSSSFRGLSSIALLLLGLAAPSLFANHDSRSRDQLVDLTGSWRFSIGDDARWAKPEFSDQEWSQIHVPAYWEEEGYRDYNGYAWYRRDFSFDDDPGQATYLLLGQIDDTDEVYVNGRRVGATGTFPPNYLGAWNQDRVYALPPGSLKDGRNVIAVRVYDGGSGGGIVGRSIGIYDSNIPLPEIDLAGTWKFHAGDDMAWKNTHFDDSSFDSIAVPAYWESAGQGDLDGFGWYRKTFRATRHSEEEKMVLMLGKIDDTDEVYLNGTKIGGTGNLNDSDRHSGVAYDRENRGYYFSSSLLKDENVLAVRVHDHGGRGGIYEGPIGVISQSRYIDYWETVRGDRRSSSGLLRFLFGNHD